MEPLRRVVNKRHRGGRERDAYVVREMLSEARTVDGGDALLHEQLVDIMVAILAGEENIREVIAFPKTQSGADPMTNAPTSIDARQLRELGLRLLDDK